MINNIIEYYYNFNAVKFLIDERMIVLFLFSAFCSFVAITGYLNYKYFIRKTRNDNKLIRGKYSIVKRILLIHYYENIYETVDRKLFDLIYRFYHFEILLTALTLISLVLSYYFDFFNRLVFILLLVCFISYGGAILCFLFGTVRSDKGGIEFRCENNHKKKKHKKKYKKKR